MDAARIGMTGVSLGGMHTWLAAAADERVAAAAPMIGVQYFGCAAVRRIRLKICTCLLPRPWPCPLWPPGALASCFAHHPLPSLAWKPPCRWAVRECRYHARVDSIPLVFRAAAADLALQHSASAAARQQPPSGSCGGQVTPEVVTAVWNVLLPGGRPAQL